MLSSRYVCYKEIGHFEVKFHVSLFLFTSLGFSWFGKFCLKYVSLSWCGDFFVLLVVVCLFVFK